MRKALIVGVLLCGGVAAFLYVRGGGASGDPNAAPTNFNSRPPMTVGLAAVTRAPLAESITVVGNLEGALSVDVASRVAGRLDAVNVRIGDHVTKDQELARVEDRELQEQVKQTDASFDIARATVRQREADLKFADTNLERARSLSQRSLLSRQDLDDAEARHQSSQAQLELARAQFDQAKARASELRITLGNTRILSPVDGFVGKRHFDPGASVTSNTPVVSVVEIGTVRLVANLVERDMRRVTIGTPAVVEVDAFPGDTFDGRVARVAPVLDPATRTAQMEIEVPNASYRLKPGMYSRVRLTLEQRAQALVVPRNAVVAVNGKRGVFLAGADGETATFREVRVGLEDNDRSEVLEGLTEGQQVISTGANGLRDGDKIQMASSPDGPRAQAAETKR